jgi:foldase protein PrsA
MSNLKRVIATLATGALCLSLAACANGGSGGDIASVNGQKLSRATYFEKLESTPPAKPTLAQMIQGALIDQYAKDNKIDASGAEIQKKEDDIKARMPAGQFDQIVAQQHYTPADLSAIFRQQIVMQKAVAPQVHVSETDIKAFFAKNHAMLDKKAQVRARHILLADLKTANEVEAKLKAGGKFDDLAKQYSTDPSNKDKGGELGWFGEGQMDPHFQAAAFSAAVGSITAPVKSPFGYHIINVEEKKPAVKATLANQHDVIRDQLKGQQETAQYPAFLAGLRQKAKIDIYDPKLADAMGPMPVVPPAGASPAAAPAPAASAK